MIKNGDFVEIDFVGKVKDSGEIFDLTKEGDAKKNNLHNPKFKYKPAVVCVGEKFVVKGLDEFLVGKDAGKHTVDINSENGFGKKDARLMKLMPSNVFLKQNIRPMVGLQVNLDNFTGTIRSISGGRVLVDFNHPLAGRDLIYDIEIKKILTNDEDKIKGYLDNKIGDVKFSFNNGKLEVNMKMDDKLVFVIGNDIKRLIPSVKDVVFKEESKSEDKKEEKKKSKKSK